MADHEKAHTIKDYMKLQQSHLEIFSRQKSLMTAHPCVLDVHIHVTV